MMERVGITSPARWAQADMPLSVIRFSCDESVYRDGTQFARRQIEDPKGSQGNFNREGHGGNLICRKKLQSWIDIVLHDCTFSALMDFATPNNTRRAQVAIGKSSRFAAERMTDFSSAVIVISIACSLIPVNYRQYRNVVKRHNP